MDIRMRNTSTIDGIGMTRVAWPTTNSGIQVCFSATIPAKLDVRPCQHWGIMQTRFHREGAQEEGGRGLQVRLGPTYLLFETTLLMFAKHTIGLGLGVDGAMVTDEITPPAETAATFGIEEFIRIVIMSCIFRRRHITLLPGICISCLKHSSSNRLVVIITPFFTITHHEVDGQD